MNLERVNLTADTPEEQILQLRSYLFQLAEQVETALEFIDESNFSARFRKRINGMEQDIRSVREEMEERQQALVVYINRQIKAINTTTEEEE
ncbi:MAG: hypothetical protein J6K15_06325 [Lachnospiraceae bacterium]|nr:hypothetical protein [Lachnospiraceae bacterium]